MRRYLIGVDFETLSARAILMDINRLWRSEKNEVMKKLKDK